MLSRDNNNIGKGYSDAVHFFLLMKYRAVALFTVALSHIKIKLKSISSRRSADILRTTVEEILLRLQNAESLIKTDV